MILLVRQGEYTISHEGFRWKHIWKPLSRLNRQFGVLQHVHPSVSIPVLVHDRSLTTVLRVDRLPTVEAIPNDLADGLGLRAQAQGVFSLCILYYILDLLSGLVVRTSRNRDSRRVETLSMR
jgi:hypothetical protein